eukprot:CAMPEP_0114576268 /NCGR_PEP_ID=MMETSP0125-20121206/1053_1 /TAXON_ID=485358 ORGANISM="Aristerostoma sp., Strain ATCC 50986" /NCGR_SAMPLE_ID=MMETSP0125 /ASSEMBLY_ACC=CAM_ASM_000245 /LENGTH=31 /DNA_ID= /DNA_START= /DNA_END= /DNA_ORIENTATION=
MAAGYITDDQVCDNLKILNFKNYQNAESFFR